MSVPVRSIHVPGAAALDDLRERARTALLSWGHQWLRDAQQMLPTLQVRAGIERRKAIAETYEVVRGTAGGLWFRCDAEDSIALALQVVGAESMPNGVYADDWIETVAHRAREARNRALYSALLGSVVEQASGSTEAPPADLFAFGSGAVELVCDSIGLHAIADSGIWRHVPPNPRATTRRSTPLAPLDRAAHSAHAQVKVMLGSVELELPKLMDMRCGDVLRLPQRLDQGIAVCVEGKPLMRAALGETRGRRAVRLMD